MTTQCQEYAARYADEWQMFFLGWDDPSTEDQALKSFFDAQIGVYEDLTKCPSEALESVGYALYYANVKDDLSLVDDIICELMECDLSTAAAYISQGVSSSD